MTTKMDVTPVKRELRRTSTPLFSGDSGYFGSAVGSQKNLYFSLSPLKESPSIKVPDSYGSSVRSISFASKFDDIANYERESCQSNVIKQLNFNDSGWGNDSASFNESQSRIIAKYPFDLYNTPNNITNESRIFPYEISVLSKPRIDFLRMLKMKNCDHVVSRLLSHVDSPDLCRMRGVSRLWRDSILRDSKANKRRRLFLKKMRSQRENRETPQDPEDIKKRYEPRLILSNITNRFQPALEKKSYNTKFESFVREGKNVQNGLLKKCPRCSYAAKTQIGDIYKCTECDYVFHKNSLSPLIYSSPMLQLPNLIIGSKLCKKNLKRL